MTPAEVVSCEFCKVFRNTYFVKHLRIATVFFSVTFNVCNVWRAQLGGLRHCNKVQLLFNSLPNLVSKSCYRSSRPGVLYKKVFWEIWQNSQENTCARVSFLLNSLSKKRLWYRCFPMKFVKFLRTPFLQNTSGQLLLKYDP